MALGQPCDIGVVFALGAEQGCTEDLLNDLHFIEAAGVPIRLGQLEGRSIVLATSGHGTVAAAKACQMLLDVHRPQWLISAGFCGGLQASLRRNDIVGATEFVDRPELSESLARACAKALASGVPVPQHQGLFATVPRIVARSADKQALGASTGALVCEMESAAVVEFCAERAAPCLVLRVVSDPVDEDLPPDLEPLMSAKSTARTLGAVVGALWRRPASAKDLWQLKENALIAADTLAKHLREVMLRLPLEPRIGNIVSDE
ncbi:MAG: hypothetical protein C0483_01870 [Pirellula sp.]|nr:hypothetical protein [Pirellula sp.]